MSSTPATFVATAQVDRKVSRLRTAVRSYVLVEGLAVVAIVLGAAFWIGLAVDWIFEPSPATRAVMWVATAALAGAAAWRWVARRAFAPLKSDSLALLMERKYPQLAEGFVTSVQASREGFGGGFRRQLLERTTQRAADALSDVRLTGVFDFRPLAQKIASAALLFGAIAVFAATHNAAFSFWIERMRLVAEPWPRLVELSALGFDERRGQRAVNVARDDAYELQVLASIVNGHQAPAEVEVRWRLADGRRGRDKMLRVGEALPGRDDAQLFKYTFKVSAAVEFDVIGGDDRIRNLRLHPVERPAVRELGVWCEFPAYMRREARLVPVSSGRCELPEGSHAVCRAAANKPLVGVHVRDQAARADVTAEISAGSRAEFEFDLGRIDEDRVLLITLRDEDGVENREPYRLAVSAAPDESPEVNVQLRGIGAAVTPQARIPVIGQLSDDYAIEESWFEFAIDDAAAARRPVSALAQGLARMRMAESFDLSEPDPQTSRPRVEVQPGQKLTLSVAARDAYDLGGEPHIGRSPRFQLDVVSPSELRALLEKRELGLRQRFEAIYEKMIGVRDLVDRIDLADDDDAADDIDGEDLTPERRRQRDLARIGGARQSAVQLSFETTGVADGFDDILAELMNNRVDTEELKQRLEEGIAEPLKDVGGAMLPQFDQRLAVLQTAMQAESSDVTQPLAVAGADAQAIVDAMKAVLDRMLELESYNELVELLRTIISEQEGLRQETLRQQRERLRNLLDE